MVAGDPPRLMIYVREAGAVASFPVEPDLYLCFPEDGGTWTGVHSLTVACPCGTACGWFGGRLKGEKPGPAGLSFSLVFGPAEAAVGPIKVPFQRRPWWFWLIYIPGESELPQ